MPTVLGEPLSDRARAALEREKALVAALDQGAGVRSGDGQGVAAGLRRDGGAAPRPRDVLMKQLDDEAPVTAAIIERELRRGWQLARRPRRVAFERSRSRSPRPTPACRASTSRRPARARRAAPATMPTRRSASAAAAASPVDGVTRRSSLTRRPYVAARPLARRPHRGHVSRLRSLRRRGDAGSRADVRRAAAGRRRAVGTVTVRVIRGVADQRRPGQDVELSGGGASATATTNDAGPRRVHRLCRPV